MKSLIIVPLFFIICSLWCNGADAQLREEFNGPFDSWANVKKRFGAKGDGKTDDTKAIQTAIDSLSNQVKSFNTGNRAYTVVYLPAGTYCISATLVLRGKIGVSIIGEDPARTTIKWIGGDSATILWANGSAYYKIARFTWDAGGRKNMEGIGIHWRNKWNEATSMSFASLNIELADNNFIGGFGTGIGGGTYGSKNATGENDSEVTVRRCVFNGCTYAGIAITGFNAIDYWVWDCRFLKCHYGLRCSHGSYHLYRSFFSGSAVLDVSNDNGYYNSVRGCYSENSYGFSFDDGASSNPFKRVYQNNTVINPNQPAIQHYHLGKITLFGNRITRSTDTNARFSVYNGSWAAGIYEMLSLHNTYTCKEPLKIGVANKKIYSYGDNIVPEIKADPQAFLKTQEPTPPRVNRKILEVPAGSDAEAIQVILDNAAGLSGQRPVVHFAPGSYNVDKTLIIAAGSDMQLKGDGIVFASTIRRKNSPVFLNKPIFWVKGPSYITLCDLQVGTDGDAGREDGIVFENVDQTGSEAYLDQVYSHADTSLFVDGMDNLYIEKKNSFFNDGNYICGGKQTMQGKGKATVSCYGGQFAGLYVRQNARFIAMDCWWEGAKRVPLNITGSGKITIDGAMIAPSGGDSLPTIRIDQFDGQISLMNMYVQGSLWARPDNPALNLLVWNVHFYFKTDILDFLNSPSAYKGAFMGLTSQCFRSNDPACKKMFSIPDQFRNVNDIYPFIDAQTAQDRLSSPGYFRNLPRRTSNIFISRISLGKMNKGIAFVTGNL